MSTKTKRTLIAFSGLSWNMKSTIVDNLCKENPSIVRLVQTNKKVLEEYPDATPMELLSFFMETNNETIADPNNKLIITDRSIFDLFIYDTLMTPAKTWQLPHVLHPIDDHDRSIYSNFLKRSYQNVLSKFDRVLIVSLETSNQKFIQDVFNQQPFSSTAYLFDNPDKYRSYSEQFNIVADRLYYFLNDLYVNSKMTYDRMYFKFTETMKPKEFIDLVSRNVLPWIK